jgi:hypothetical protein
LVRPDFLLERTMFFSNVPVWFFALLLFIVVWNGVHSYIEFRQKKRQMDIEMYGKNVTAVVHARNALPAIPGAIDNLVSSRHIASPAAASAATAVASAPVVVSPAVAVSSAAPVSAPSFTGAPVPSLPVVEPDVLNPIDTLRMPLTSGGELLICGYPGPAAPSDVVSLRLAFVRFNGQQTLLGSFPANQREDDVIEKAKLSANRVVRKAAKTIAASKRSSAAVQI